MKFLETKKCGTCKEEKPIVDFNKDKSRTDGLQRQCKDCVREYRKSNRDRIQKQKAEYHKKNREKLREYDRKRRAENSEAESARSKQYYRENRDEILLRRKERREANPEVVKDIGLRHKYNITLEQYNKMLKEQEYVCAICKRHDATEKSLSVDHDHKCCPGVRSCGDCVRALLCSRCNTGLGQFGNDEGYLQEALKYIKKYRTN